MDSDNKKPFNKPKNTGWHNPKSTKGWRNEKTVESEESKTNKTGEKEFYDKLKQTLERSTNVKKANDIPIITLNRISMNES